jgi:hypothetical protein
MEVQKLQRAFRKKRFLKEFYHTKPVLDTVHSLLYVPTDNIENNHMVQFDRCTTYIRRKDVIQKISLFLSKLYQIRGDLTQTLDVRTFLSAYTIYGYPQIVLEKESEQAEHTGIDSSIFHAAKRLVEVVHIYTFLFAASLYPNKDDTLFETLEHYRKEFAMFLHADKIRKTNLLLEEWYSMEQTVEEIEKSELYTADMKPECIHEVRTAQRRIVTLLHKISRNLDKNFLPFYKKVRTTLEHNIKKAYWDNIQQDILQHDFTSSFQLIEEIKTFLTIIHPTKTTEIATVVDIPFLQQQATHNVITFASLVPLFSFLVQLLAEGHSVVKGADILSKWNSLQSEMGEQNVSGSIRTCFEFLMVHLEDLKQDIISFRLLSMME